MTSLHAHILSNCAPQLSTPQLTPFACAVTACMPCRKLRNYQDSPPARAVRRDRRLVDVGLKDILAEDIFKESKAPLRFAAPLKTAALSFQMDRTSTQGSNVSLL